MDFQPALCCESYMESLAGRQIALARLGAGDDWLVVREPVPDGHQKLTRRGRLMTLHAPKASSQPGAPGESRQSCCDFDLFRRAAIYLDKI